MLLDLGALAATYDLEITGVLHVGAHLAEEVPLYEALHVPRVWWVEANPAVRDQILARLPTNHHLVEALVTDEDHACRAFHITNHDGMSSSVFEFGTHAALYPDTLYESTATLETRTLDSLVREHDIRPVNFLTLDLQGAELLALRGAPELLSGIDYIFTELSTVELYRGGARLEELEAFLCDFRLVEQTLVGEEGWGDGFFVRVPPQRGIRRADERERAGSGSGAARPPAGPARRARRIAARRDPAAARYAKAGLRAARSAVGGPEAGPGRSLRRAVRSALWDLGYELVPRSRPEPAPAGPDPGEAEPAPTPRPFYDVSPTCQVENLALLYTIYFGERADGRFVEIGAYDGFGVSNTSCLADAGWHGDLLEPVPASAQACRARYADNPRITVTEAAAAAAPGTIPIQVAGVLSSAAPRALAEVREASWSKSVSFGEVLDVAAVTLDGFLEDRGVAPGFEVLVVDVEGYEAEVFAGFDLERWRPQMLIVELVDAHPDLSVSAPDHARLARMIAASGYVVAYKDSGNTIFVTGEVYDRAHRG